MPTARPVRATAPKARPVRAVKPLPAARDTSAFTGLGTWFDLYDDPSKLVAAVRDMPSRGVRTLYLEWAKSYCKKSGPFPDVAAIGSALDEAHRRGVRVVAWYYLDFTDVTRDLQQTLAAITYTSPGGERFDAVGIDIEDNVCVPDVSERNARLIDFSKRLRDAAGSYPIAAIVIAPTSLKRSATRWPEFPWSSIAPLYDVFMPMNYWTFSSADPETAKSRTADNAALAARLTGRPVHVIGGLAEKSDLAQTRAYVEAALAGGSIGGGLYDYVTTTSQDVWTELGRFNR